MVPKGASNARPTPCLQCTPGDRGPPLPWVPLAGRTHIPQPRPPLQSDPGSHWSLHCPAACHETSPVIFSAVVFIVLFYYSSYIELGRVNSPSSFSPRFLDEPWTSQCVINHSVKGGGPRDGRAPLPHPHPCSQAGGCGHGRRGPLAELGSGRSGGLGGIWAGLAAGGIIH